MTSEAIRQVLDPVPSAPSDPITPGTLDSLVSSNLGVAVDPQTSVLRWVQEKSLIQFSVCSSFSFLSFFKKIYLCMAILGHCCCLRAFSKSIDRGLLLLPLLCRLLIAAASLVTQHRLQSTGSGVVVPGFGCSVAGGIFLGQGSNLCALHWQLDS